MNAKAIKRIIHGSSVSDGAGVRLNRLIGTSELDNIDPFFLLDEFRSNNPDDYIAGFPMHPHRGIETITYMVEGSFRHKDSRGGGGVLNAGDVQWMTAGKGIQHEEMPAMEKGQLWGYQLWLNLPKKFKMVEPKYQHITTENTPVYEQSGNKVIVISGSFEGLQGAANNYVPAEYYDVHLGTTIKMHAKKDYNSFIYIHSGAARIENQEITAGSMVEFHEGNEILIESSSANTGFLFLSAKPNNEPYARGGPFIMNTREEIAQAFDDYQNGKLF